jgi:hypothetical protein
MKFKIVERKTETGVTSLYDLFEDGKIVNTGYGVTKLVYQAVETDARVTAEKIKQVFKDLRKNGIACRFGINRDSKAGVKWGDSVENTEYAYCDALAVKHGLTKYNNINIYYSTGKDNDDVSVAEALVIALNGQGLKTDWDGSPWKAVTVYGDVQYEDVEQVYLDD